MALIDDLINDIKNKQSVFITGAAGVGKTTILLQLYDILKEKLKLKIVLTSTIGMNAINLGGVTIHRFSGINTQTDIDYIKTIKESSNFKSLASRIKKVNIVAIDEISMLRADQFNLIDLIFREVTKKDIPFGGKTLILTGDFYQLPPVTKNFESLKDQWVFNSKSWQNMNIKTYELSKVKRQEEIKFINFLNKMRIGEIEDDITVQKIIDQCSSRKILDNDTIFFSRKDECDNYNNYKLSKIQNKQHNYEAIVYSRWGVEQENAIIKECIARKTLSLKKGASVITIINDPDKRFYNGSKAIITKLQKDKITIKLNDTNKEIVLTPYVWSKKNAKGVELARMIQFPIILAYALTIHKSQGMTLDTAVVDCKNIFTYGQMYVAISRVKKLENLTIINFDPSKVICSNEVKKFYKKSKIIYID